MINLTVEEENLLSIYADEDGDKDITIDKLQNAATLCDDDDMITIICSVISKLDYCTDEQYMQVLENIVFTGEED